MDIILPKKDVMNRVVVFFPDSFDKEKDTITFWDGVHGHQKETTSAQYYHTSKPVSDEEIADISARYTSNFGTKELLVRRKLYKENTFRKSDQNKPGDDKLAQMELAEKLITAITKAIRDAVAH